MTMGGEGMNIIETLFLNSVFILFPLFSYFLFATSEHNLSARARNILFDFALYTSLYLILKCDTPHVAIRMMLLTVPLLIAYLKSKKLAIIIFSLCIGLYYVYSLKINPIYVIVEFLIYFIFIYILKRRNESKITIISVFTIIKIAFIIIEPYNFINSRLDMINEIFILSLSFYVTTHLICYFMDQSEKTMNLHMTLKELEHQKQLRDSLFKITHEIKNPIAVCKGYLDMFDTNNDNHVKKYIPIIKQEIERTLTLMEDFMMLTKLKVEKREMDISVLLQDVLEISSLTFQGRKIKFDCSLIDEEQYIEGDYNRLKQVFINIIKNAVEAIPYDKKGVIKFNVKTTSKSLVIIIADNGIGMTKEQLKKIGEPFFTTKKSGTGLGVKFSNEIIVAHEGHIEYKSKSNVGTRVTIFLPLKKSF